MMMIGLLSQCRARLKLGVLPRCRSLVSILDLNHLLLIEVAAMMLERGCLWRKPTWLLMVQLDCRAVLAQ